MVQSLSAQARASNFARPTGFDSITSGGGLQQRRAMAKAITLLESTRADHRQQADELLTGAHLPLRGVEWEHGKPEGKEVQGAVHGDHGGRACTSGQ